MKLSPVTNFYYSNFQNRKDLKATNTKDNVKVFEFPTCATIKHEILFKSSQIISKERLKKLNEFQERYGLKFNNIHTLNQVFLYGTDEKGNNIRHSDTYQRLEFLGDDVLELCTNKIICENYPNFSEGKLTELKQRIVCNENIARYAKQLGLDELTFSLPVGKRLADIFEALLGAIFIDGGDDGFKNACEFFEKNFKKDILSINTPTKRSNKEILKQYLFKTGRSMEKLGYSTSYENGAFTCDVTYENELLASSRAGSERKAQANAFGEALIRLVELDSEEG